MIRLTVTVEGEKQLQLNISRLERSMKNFKPMLERIGEVFRQSETGLFARAPWAPLSPRYAARKRRRFPGKTILRATDRLYNSFTRVGAEDNINRVSALDGEFGSGVPYGVFHQHGTWIMPARPPLQVTDQDFKKFDEIAETHMQRMIREAGFS